MVILRNKRKLAAVAKKTQEELPRNSQSRNTSVPRINEECITQVSQEIEVRVRKKTVPRIQQDKVSHFECSVKVRRISLEPTDMDALRSRSGNISEHGCRKPGTNWGSFPEWSPSWSGALSLSVPHFNWFRTRRGLSQLLAGIHFGYWRFQDFWITRNYVKKIGSYLSKKIKKNIKSLDDHTK